MVCLLLSLYLIQSFLMMRETLSNVFGSTIEQFQLLTICNLSCNGRDHYEIHKTWAYLGKLSFLASLGAMSHILYLWGPCHIFFTFEVHY